MDWKDSLQSFLDNNPDIPTGIDSTAETTDNATAVMTQKPKVAVERKGHRGKTVTIIHGFTCSDRQLAELASSLKRRLGTGGSARGGEILVQGDRRAEVEQWIREEFKN